MDTCILMPEEFSLVLTLHPNPKNILEMNVALWSNRSLPPGLALYPDQGVIRLDKLEVYTYLQETDVRRCYGSQDTISRVDGRDVRHCNWVRFLKSSDNVAEVNIVGVLVKNQVIFKTIKTILPNEEIVAFMPDPEGKHWEKAREDGSLTRLHSPELGVKVAVKQEMDIEPISPAVNPATIGLLTSPVARDDDCKSSVSDATYYTEDDKMSQYSSPHVSSSDGADSDTLSPHTPPTETPPSVTSTSPPSTPPTPASESQPIRRNRERTWLPCDICGKKFDRPSLLKRHMRVHTGEKPHACDVCGKAFSTSSSLNTHRRIHSGEKPHECQVCGKRFTASSNLYYHRMTHNKEKPHKCQMCEKSFPTPGDLRSHMYVHNGSWPFRCDVCNRGFSKQTNLKNHLLLHTGDKPHECRTCKKKFALLCNLKTHLKTHEEDNQGSCVTCGRTYLKDVTSHSSDRCKDCIRALSSPQTPSPSSRTVSDFSISKLTNQDEKRDNCRSPHNPGTSDPDFLCRNMYRTRQFASPTLGMPQCASPRSPGEQIPMPFVRGFPIFGLPTSEGLALHTQFRLASGVSPGLALAELLYQSKPALPGCTGLMAK